MSSASNWSEGLVGTLIIGLLATRRTSKAGLRLAGLFDGGGFEHWPTAIARPAVLAFLRRTYVIGLS